MGREMVLWVVLLILFRTVHTCNLWGGFIVVIDTLESCHIT